MKKSFLFLFALFLLSTSTVFPQFRMKLGPYTGMNFNIGTGSDLPETLTGFSFFFGSQIDMKFTPIVGLITQVQFYDSRSGSYSYTGQFDRNGDGIADIQGTLDNDYSLAYFMIQPLLKLNLPASNFYFVIGPSIGFNIESSIEQTLTPQAQQGFQQQQPLKGKATLKNMNVRFELTAGAGYDISLGSLLDLTPQFTFGYGITTVQQDFSARILTFQLGVAAKFKII